MTLEEFRIDLINEINSTSIIDSDYPADVFVEYCKDILINDFGVLSDLERTFVEYKTDNNKFRSMRIDASYLELSINTIHLLYSDFSDKSIETINNANIQTKSTQMLNFMNNLFKDYFKNSADSDPTTQLARDILKNKDLIHKVHLIIISTNRRSERLKTTFSIEPLIIEGKKYSVDLTFLDIERIYETKLATFKREDIIINTKDFGLNDGIPCIKADIECADYDSYMAVVPGKFLADIYMKYSARLLESNVRSFLNTKAEINKGILNTILNDKSRFFAYNNGIATVAEEINIENTNGSSHITEFRNLQIINGGQTTASLASAVIKNDANLDGIFVQMKLTLIKNNDASQELIRLISKYSNKQNKVTNADLNSNHQFYSRMEEFSRKIKTPLLPNKITQSSWFFERTRGQYDQMKMQCKDKRERDLFEMQNPKAQKFSKTDLAKFINSSEMKPYDVSWGADVNMTRFQLNIEKEWEKNNAKFNEGYYKELISKAILFKEIERIISNEEWYQNNKGYRAQLVPYTFSKFVFEVKKINKLINYKKIWELQGCLDAYKVDLAKISKIAYDVFNDPARQFTNIGEYAKRENCWNIVKEKTYHLSNETISLLIDKLDKEVESKIERKEQTFTNDVCNEIIIFNLGIPYWENLIEIGKKLNELDYAEIQACETAIKYIKQIYTELSKKQKNDIWKVKTKMEKYLN